LNCGIRALFVVGGLFLSLGVWAQDRPLELLSAQLGSDDQVMLVVRNYPDGYCLSFEPDMAMAEILSRLPMPKDPKSSNRVELMNLIPGSNREYVGLADWRVGGPCLYINKGTKPLWHLKDKEFPIRLIGPDKILSSRNEIEYENPTLLTDVYKWIGDHTNHYPTWKAKGICPKYLTLETSAQKILSKFGPLGDGLKTTCIVLVTSEPFQDSARILVHLDTILPGESKGKLNKLCQICVFSLDNMGLVATKTIPGRCRDFELRNDDTPPMALLFNERLERYEWQAITLLGSSLEFTLVGEEIGLYRETGERANMKAGGGTIAVREKDQDEIKVYRPATGEKRVIPAHGMKRLYSVSADGDHILAFTLNQLYWFDLNANKVTLYRFVTDEKGETVRAIVEEEKAL
jgi:hypothetical protein